MFNFNHLYYFYMTAKLKGVMNASKALRIAQPSLTSQIKTLEKSLDQTLFQKVGRRLVLTPDGERVYGFCCRMFEAAEELQDYLSNNILKGTRYRIGVTPEIERPFIADVLGSLLKNKQLENQPLLSMISSGHQDLTEKLKISELDAIVTTNPVYDQDVQIVSRLSMPVIAVASPLLLKKFKLSEESSLAEIFKRSDVGFVLPSESLKMRIETDLFLQKYKPKNLLILESDILAVVVRATLEGIGIAFLPKHYILKELKQGKLIALNKGSTLWKSDLLFLTKFHKNPNPIIQDIKDYFNRIGAQ